MKNDNLGRTNQSTEKILSFLSLSDYYHERRVLFNLQSDPKYCKTKFGLSHCLRFTSVYFVARSLEETND